MKQFNTMVIYCHSMEWWYYHGMAVNYRGKKFYNIGPRWLQRVSRICFATFICRKITKLIITGQLLKPKKKWAKIWNHWILEIFKCVCSTKFKRNKILFSKIRHQFPMTTSLFYPVKHPHLTERYSPKFLKNSYNHSYSRGALSPYLN